MYAYIKGTLEEIGDGVVILENNGIGYRVFVPQSVMGEISRGDEVKLYTYFSVKEDSMQLYGFLSKDDLEIYRLLLNVSGVGPKGALGILSVLDADDLRFAILSGDAQAISKAPGIGKKTAQKVIIELKDKMDLEDAFEKKSEHVADSKTQVKSSIQSEAVLALTALGYSGSEALKAVKAAMALDETMGVEDLIKTALKQLY